MNEDGLREPGAQALLREMIDDLPLIHWMWMHEAEGERVVVNDAFCEFFGVTADELDGGRWHALVHPDDVDVQIAELLASLRELRPFHGEARCRRADGEWRWLESWARPRISESGKFRGVVGISADVTDRKQSEATLQIANRRIAEHHALLRAVYDALDDGLLVFDMRGETVMVNEAAAGMSGYASTAEMQESLAYYVENFEVFDLDGTPLPLSEWPLTRVLRGERFSQRELRARRFETGAEQVMSMSGQPVFDERGEQILAVLVIRNIGDRVRAEQALRESEERLMLAQDAAALGIHDYDMITGAMHWDERVRELWGVGPDEPVTYPMFIAGLNPEDIPKIGAAVSRAINPASDGRYFAEYRVINRRDGRERWVFATGSVVFERGHAVRLVGTIQDISERKQAEAALRASEERLRESDRRKNEYLAMLGHELRNPLAVIHNATELLVRCGIADPRVDRIAEVLGRQSKHMTRLIDGLLEVSRIARGKIQLEAIPLELGAVCAEVLADRRGLIATYGLELDERLTGEPTWVLADRVRFAQIFDNLLTNALKFTPAPGRITVALERDEGHAILRVADTGIGIPQDKLEQIFEPFHQEGQGIDRGRGGLGLGLALSKGLVELHGGTIEARSPGLGAGAEFVVRLPLCSEPAATSGALDHGADGVARRILIIEDNSDAAQTLLDLLRLGGHEVRTAQTGPEGLEILRREHQEVVLCDIGLPGMSGHELARAVRADAELRGTLLIAVTGYGQPEDLRRSTAAGFDAHLTKPVTLDAIERVLRRHPPRARSPQR